MRITTDKSMHPLEAILLSPCIMLAPYVAMRFVDWEGRAMLYLIINVALQLVAATWIHRRFNAEMREICQLEARAARTVAAGDNEELAAAISAWNDWEKKHPP